MKHFNEYQDNPDLKDQIDQEIVGPILNFGYRVVDSGSLAIEDPQLNAGVHLIVLAPINEEHPGIEELLWKIEDEDYDFHCRIHQSFDLIFINLTYYA